MSSPPPASASAAAAGRMALGNCLGLGLLGPVVASTSAARLQDAQVSSFCFTACKSRKTKFDIRLVLSQRYNKTSTKGQQLTNVAGQCNPVSKPCFGSLRTGSAASASVRAESDQG